MASVFDQVLVHYRDAAGRIGTNFFTLSDQDGGELPDSFVDLRNAIQDVSDAHVFAIQYQWTNTFSGAAVDGPYGTTQDRLALLGQVGASTTTYDIVAPTHDLWLPDNKTLDLDDPRVIELEAAMCALIGRQDGTVLSRIKRGRRQWASTRS